MENSYILRNPSENELINVIDLTFSNFCNRTLKILEKNEFLKKNPNAEFSVKKEISKLFTGIHFPFGNFLWGANFNEQDVKEKVDTIVRQAKLNNQPFIWMVGALSKPHNLDDFLMKAGLIKTESTGMYLNLRDLNELKY